MPKTAKINASTQKFTEIQDISGPIVLLDGGNACLVIEVTASNFALLSKKEQDAKIYAYASLINSLSFPVQVLIRNQCVDITSYLKMLEQAEKQAQNQFLAQHIGQYREFVHQMIKVNVVLNKEFYLVVTYSPLEKGAQGAATGTKKGGEQKQILLDDAKKSLLSKAESLLTQLKRLALSAKVMQEEELVKLFYNIYNFDTLEIAQVSSDLKSPLVKTQEAI